MRMEKIRGSLSENGKKMFDDIVSQRVLGASTHIRMIGDMFLDLAEEGKKRGIDVKELKEEIEALAGFFIETRGKASCAVTNGIHEMLAGMSGLETMEMDQAEKAINNAVSAYREKTRENLEKIVEYAARFSKNMKKILVFDYSSTVNAFLEAKEGADIEVFIPESRSINGGAAFARTTAAKRIRTHFIPDAAMMYYLRQCDGAFCGAETALPDGTAYNTTGSEMAALVCKTLGVPFYVLTPMMKIDGRGLYGYHREAVVNDLKSRFASVGLTEEEMEKIDFSCPELLPIPAEYITGFITELGIIPAAGFYAAAAGYLKQLEGGKE